MYRSDLDVADLNEMLGIAYIAKSVSETEVRVDTDHIIEILTRLLAWETEG